MRESCRFFNASEEEEVGAVIMEQQIPSETEQFPSLGFLVRTYMVGAIIAIVLGFSMTLDTTQVTICLGLGWFLTSGALFMSVFLQLPKENENLHDGEEDRF